MAQEWLGHRSIPGEAISTAMAPNQGHEPSSTEGEVQRFKLRHPFIGSLSEDGHHGAVRKLRKAVERRDALVADARMAIGKTGLLHLANHETESVSGLLPRSSCDATAERVNAYHGGRGIFGKERPGKKSTEEVYSI